MKFYNREKELEKLRQIEKTSHISSKMTIIVGRRRIGKTKLIKKAFPEKLYFFVAKKNEALLCEEFTNITRKTLNIKILGQIVKFKDLFEFLLEQAKDRPITLVIDEFQEFLNINDSLYSDMQNLWDSYKDSSKMNLVLCGSIYKKPLFGRADNKIHLQSFTTETLAEILQENSPEFNHEDLLSFYILTGGIAKYIEVFVDNQAFDLQSQLDLIFDEYSLFLEEGKNLLIEEFGKEYTTYFSILSLIASARNTRSEIENILTKNVGGHLDKLENEYTIIRKIKPLFAKAGSRKVKFEIIDNFLNFWFRFIYKYKSAIEIGNYNYVKEKVLNDYTTYSGHFLEKFFIEKLKLSRDFSTIGTYWEKKNLNEIDIVAVNDELQTMLIAEVKRNEKKIDLKRLHEKAKKLLEKHPGYTPQFVGYSLRDIQKTNL